MGEIPSIDSSVVTVLAALILHDSIITEGTASSGRYAKIKASEKALEAIDGLPAFEFRRRYHCDCRGGENSVDVGVDTAD